MTRISHQFLKARPLPSFGVSLFYLSLIGVVKPFPEAASIVWMVWGGLLMLQKLSGVALFGRDHARTVDARIAAHIPLASAALGMRCSEVGRISREYR
jgi:hypothetical protein